MEFRTITVAASVMIPLGVFLYLRKYLDSDKHIRQMMLFSGGLALLGLLFVLLDTDRYSYCISLVNPLFSFLIYRGLFLFFVKKMNRPPIDTAFNWDDDLPWDRVFNIAYIVLGIVTLIAFTIYFIVLMKG